MHTELDEDVIRDYGYDIGYYEGIRNTLMIINKHLAFAGSPKENVKRLLKEIREELDDASDCQKDSERSFIQMQADLNFNCY